MPCEYSVYFYRKTFNMKLKVKPRDELKHVDAYNVSYSVTDMRNPNFIKIDANENPFALPKNIETLLHKAISKSVFARYPDPLCTSLREKISKRVGVGIDNLLVGNGSDELLGLIAHCFFGKKVMIPEFSYPVYSHLAKISNMKALSLPVKKEDFSLRKDLGFTLKKEQPDLVFFACPNNPTGNLYDKDLILSAIDENPETLFVIDEAYYDFCGKSLLKDVSKKQNTIVLRTLSKAYGVAGLRVGFAIAQQPLIEMLKKVKLPYNMSLISQEIAEAIYDPMQDFVAQTVEVTCRERKRLSEALSKQADLKVFPSETNFLFAKLPDQINAQAFLQKFMKQKIQVRLIDYAENGLFWRLSIGTPEQNNKVIKVCNDIMNEAERPKTNPNQISLKKSLALK